jgi:hypothetical protein
VKTDREVMQQALKALEAGPDVDPIFAGETEAALRARLAEPETCKPALQVEEVEPVAWMLALPNGRLERLSVVSYDDEAKEMLAQSLPGCTMVPLYPPPPARRPLTDDEIKLAVLSDPIYGAALMSMMRDGVTVAQLREAVSGIARAIERAHKIGGNDD